MGDTVATGTVGGGVEGGAADAVRAGGPIVLGGGVVADATGSVADGGGAASSVGAGVGATVGAMVGTAGTTRRVAGGDTASPVGLTAASPRVDGAREVPAESTSQMATATALRPRTRSTPRAERMVAVTRYCHGPQDPSQAVLGASAARIMATGEARLTALDDAPFHLRVGQCVGHCFDDLRSTAFNDGCLRPRSVAAGHHGVHGRLGERPMTYSGHLTGVRWSLTAGSSAGSAKSFGKSQRGVAQLGSAQRSGR